MSPRSPLPVLFLVGPTASGKKRVAAKLTTSLPVRLLSLDSMKVYRGMDRGTDKSDSIPFGLTNLVEPSQPFSVGDYARLAEEQVTAARSAREHPLFVGGTGLYLRALTKGLFEGPEIPPGIRDEWRRQLSQRGGPALHEELSRVDPTAAARIHPNDGKRITRALEVHTATGVALSDWQQRDTKVPFDGPHVLVGLRWEPSELRRRIAVRVDRMLKNGLVNEVRQLRDAGRLGPVAAEAIGYREVLEMLETNGDEPTCRERIVTNTWRFSRRQENWFRQFPSIDWIPMKDDPESIGDRVLERFQQGISRCTDRSSRS